MPFSSDDLTPQQQWQEERRADFLAQFDKRIPELYTDQITLPAAVADWATAGWNTPSSLFLTGPIGVGKTHTAWTAVRTWISTCFDQDPRRKPVVAIHRSTNLFDDLRPEADNPRGVTKTCQTADLLFIDDLAAARVSPSGWTQERLYEIFDERYTRKRPVILTCDVLPNTLSDIVGQRVASRLAEMCRGRVHFLSGRDRRMGGGK